MTASTPAPVSSNSANLPSSAARESPSANLDCADREVTSSSGFPKSNCVRPDSNSNTYAKRKHRLNMREVQAMQFIKEHTTIPVPDIYSYRIDGSDSIIEMERIAGITLKECIAQNRVTTDHIQRIAEQLNDYIHQMRGLQSDVVGPCIWTDSDTEQALHDPFVPFPTPMPMHEAEAFMMNNLLQHRESRPPTGFTQMFSKYLKQHTYTINLTHGDLLPRNIMVDPDTCQITGILDWEFSGFYPEYWEYSRMTSHPPFDSVWFSIIDLIKPEYLVEACYLNVYIQHMIQ